METCNIIQCTDNISKVFFHAVIAVDISYCSFPLLATIGPRLGWTLDNGCQQHTTKIVWKYLPKFSHRDGQYLIEVFSDKLAYQKTQKIVSFCPKVYLPSVSQYLVSF